MSWTDCQRYCIGLCPCPEPPWLWNCNNTSNLLKSESRDPQIKFCRLLHLNSYWRSLQERGIWSGEYL